jgi:cytochrome c556
MKKLASTTLLLALLGTAAALADAHSDREAVMRANNGAMRALQPLVANFDAAAAKAQGQILVDNAAKIKAAFAPGTDQNDEDALPAIWTDAAGFSAAADKFAADAAAIGAATDGPSLQAAIQAVNADCGGCHRSFRKPPAGRGGARGGAAPAPAQ